MAKYHKRPACDLTQAGRLRYSEKASVQRDSKVSEWGVQNEGRGVQDEGRGCPDCPKCAGVSRDSGKVPGCPR